VEDVQHEQNGEQESEKVMFGDMRGEDEKLTQALEMALTEISKDKTEADDDEEGKT
jgi:hypothetical protein